ncbi:MAG: hypothetical protein LBL49_03655 [Clostridiales Family XIII bacterium]|nr:hypothetical protein [Clostridiales Family XIII bacterium]
MKKRIIILIALAVMWIPGLAAEQAAFAADIGSVSEIVLEEGENEFSLSIDVRQPAPYAGAEFSLACGEGVSVKSVKYSDNGSSAGPTEARGFTWFSFFSDQNAYSGTVTADVTLEYSVIEASFVSIENVSVYTVDGRNVHTSDNNIKRNISISRTASASETADEGSQEAIGGSGTPLADVPTGGNDQGRTYSSGGDSRTAEGADGGLADNDAAAPDADSDETDLRTIDEPETPKTDIQSEDAKRDAGGSLLLLAALLVVSLMGNLLLGYLIIKKRSRSDAAS